MGKHYLDNSLLEKKIRLYLECSAMYPNPHAEELMGLFDILISNIHSSFKFKIGLEDAKQDCFVVILTTLKNFDPSKSSAFNYYTTVIANELRRIYSKDKKYEARILKYIEHLKHKQEWIDDLSNS